MSARRALVYLLVAAGAACRAPQIPVERRYPAGTPFRAQYLVVDGTRLRVIDTGSGAPVVFIHGFGASIYSWRKTLPPVLAAGYRVIAFDNRGFGFSDKPAAPAAEGLYTNAAYARLVVALLDSLNLPSAVLVGHSMGGAIAAEVALRYPDRVRGLVLIDAAGFGVRWPGALRVGRWPGAGGVAAALRGRWITERLLRSTYGDPSKVTEEDVDQYYAPVAEPGYGRALRGVLREFRFDTLVGRMSAVAAPTLVVWGSADRWIPMRDGSRLATELPRGAFIVLKGIGHAAAEESPDEVNKLLITFLKEGLPRVPENLVWSTPSSRPGASAAGRFRVHREDPRARLIAAGKPIYWASGSIHSPETGSPEMLMEVGLPAGGGRYAIHSTDTRQHHYTRGAGERGRRRRSPALDQWRRPTKDLRFPQPIG